MVIPAGFLFAATYAFFSVAFGDRVERSDAVFGAFLGAFFAFLFVHVGEALTKLYDRAVRNHTGLVRLEHYLNESIDLLAENITVAQQVRQHDKTPECDTIGVWRRLTAFCGTKIWPPQDFGDPCGRGEYSGDFCQGGFETPGCCVLMDQEAE